jgi:hypothetical protein
LTQIAIITEPAYKATLKSSIALGAVAHTTLNATQYQYQGHAAIELGRFLVLKHHQSNISKLHSLENRHINPIKGKRERIF